jgi:hypothetical protein
VRGFGLVHMNSAIAKIIRAPSFALTSVSACCQVLPTAKEPPKMAHNRPAPPGWSRGRARRQPNRVAAFQPNSVARPAQFSSPVASRLEGIFEDRPSQGLRFRHVFSDPRSPVRRRQSNRQAVSCRGRRYCRSARCDAYHVALAARLRLPALYPLAFQGGRTPPIGDPKSTPPGGTPPGIQKVPSRRVRDTSW